MPPSSTGVARNLASMVALSHTIFGLPFGLVSAALAHRAALADGEPGLTVMKLLWIVLAFTGARTAAMSFNRIVDRDIDRQNPRTASRELPSGKVSIQQAIALTLGASFLFLVSAGALGSLSFWLSPFCLAIVFSYSLAKRWGWGCHLLLGLALSLSPFGAWIGVRDSLAGWPVPLALMLAVGTWVAGFDIIYSLQDERFDRGKGLHSIPVRFGATGALFISALLHVVTILALCVVHSLADLGVFHILAIMAMSALLFWEHWIVRPDDLSRVNRAFFDLNGYAGIAYLVLTLFDLWRLGS